MKDFSKRILLIFLVSGVLASNFTNLLSSIEEDTLLILVEELPDTDSKTSEKDIDKDDTKTFERLDLIMKHKTSQTLSIVFKNITTYTSVYKNSVTPPPKLV